jgi:hypothetical protein
VIYFTFEYPKPSMPHKVATRVYTYNPTGIAVVVIFIMGLVIFIFHLLSMSTLQIGIVGSIFLGGWLYVYYGDNPNWQMRIWGKRRLIFSSDTIRFGEDHYPVSELETAAVYLESFDGFEYRALENPGTRCQGKSVERKADGNNNKISFRHKGEIEDFTFYLASYAQYAEFMAVINDWSVAGVNVVVRQIFEDGFIMEEMGYFNTAAGSV